jgi:hypothetical protein
MRSIWDAFGADTKALREGAWIPITDARGNQVCEVLLRYTYSPQARQIAAEIRKAEGEADLTIEAEARVIRRAIVEGCLLDWRGVTHPETGEEIPYSPETANKLMEMLPEFLGAVMVAAASPERFPRVDLKEASEALGNGSGGSSGGDPSSRKTGSKGSSKEARPSSGTSSRPSLLAG